LIFHEGNITENQQQYISNQTPELKIKFVNIANGKAFRRHKEFVRWDGCEAFGMGYRHMCSFWFIDFWHFVKDYDLLLRIDDDCTIQCNIDNIFKLLEKHIFVSGREEPDLDYVTIGMNALTVGFMKNNLPSREASKKYPPTGPYTNVIAINLSQVRKEPLFKKYVDCIDESNGIYTNRWGDLPLWGEAIHYIFGDKSLKIDTDLKYYHGSHNTQVN
jgi:hypothetical protein